MILRWQYAFKQIGNRLWFRASLFVLLGIAAALVAVISDPLIPQHLPTRIGSDAVGPILNILASSMLAVTTFSLSIMVGAFGAASSNLTPRSTKLLMEDATTQNVLAVFIGTFLFSIVGIAALNTGYYNEKARFVLFVFSICVIALVTFTILRWIDYLARLGRVGETTERVERAASKAIDSRLGNPYLGGHHDAAVSDLHIKAGVAVFARDTGYVKTVDMSAMQAAAKALDTDICLRALPGSLVHPAYALAIILPPENNRVASTHSLDQHRQCEEKIRKAFIIGSERSYDQDPRFGLIVLSEIASRALSAAVNDPGTAIDVIGRGMRLIFRWIEKQAEPDNGGVAYENIYVPEITISDLFDDLFAPIARDGASAFEVQIRLQKALLALATAGDAIIRLSCEKQSQHALERAEKALVLESEKQILRDIAAKIEMICKMQDQLQTAPSGRINSA